MRINNIAPVGFRNGVLILDADNKENKILYNQIQKITNDYKIPATFKPGYSIELSRVNDIILAKIKELGIKIVK